MIKNKRLLLATVSLMMLGACSFTGGGGSNPSTNENPSNISENSTPLSLGEVNSMNIDLKLFENLPTIRLSSIRDDAPELKRYYKMEAPIEDKFAITSNFSDGNIQEINVFEETGKFVMKITSNVYLPAKAHQVFLFEIIKKDTKDIKIDVFPRKHKICMPYEKLDTNIDKEVDLYGNPDVDPLEASLISAVKREGGYYINCNNPEALEDNTVNHILHKQEGISGPVFFTFEHNNKVSTEFYYAYKVINRNDHDVFITMRNMGYHLDGAGSWLGQDEWIQFYNVDFEYDDSNWTEAQWAEFESLYNFSKEYKARRNQPITYRLPAGQSMNVMGGLSEDAYNHYDVFNTADRFVKGGCSNAACLFDVVGGKVDGAFMAYQSLDKIPSMDSQELGYQIDRDKPGDHKYGAQYGGYEEVQGVVDISPMWTFNDNTRSQRLPVRYFNEHSANHPNTLTGEPYTKVPNLQKFEQNRTDWVTHINPCAATEAMGTDMTKYITKTMDGKEICIDYQHFDGRGQLANIGNWMIDYQENYTFVNQGEKERTVQLFFADSGSVCAFIRDEEDNVIQPEFSITRVTNMAGQRYSYKYETTIAPHSVKRFTLDYNLLANSAGYMKHWVNLI